MDRNCVRNEGGLDGNESGDGAGSSLLGCHSGSSLSNESSRHYVDWKMDEIKTKRLEMEETVKIEFLWGRRRRIKWFVGEKNERDKRMAVSKRTT